MSKNDEQPDEFDSMLKELQENWEQISTQMMSNQLPTSSFAMSALADFEELMEQSTRNIKKIITKKQKSDGGIQNTILPMRDKKYFKEFATSIGCVYVMAVLAKRWDELEFLPPSLQDL